jgi:tryptophan synthase alpha chain
VLVGFGISDKKTFDEACRHAEGAIIGSAFVKAMAEGGDVSITIKKFINSLRS